MAVTAPVRIPQEMLKEVKQVAALSGETPAELLAKVWSKYLDENRSALADEFSEAARILRERDTDAFLERTRSARRTRAEAAAAKLA